MPHYTARSAVLFRSQISNSSLILFRIVGGSSTISDPFLNHYPVKRMGGIRGNPGAVTGPRGLPTPAAPAQTASQFSKAVSSITASQFSKIRF
jgi:hypothetical protein